MHDDLSPTARALLALELLQARPGIRAAELGERLGVSERAARRYVGVLRDAGVPVESVRGPYGGYRVGRGLRLPPLMFTPAEALGLVMALLDSHHGAVRDGPVATALGKLVRALPEPVARPVEAIRQVAAHGREAVPPPSAEITARLVEACAERRVVRLRHHLAPDGRIREMEVEPWALVARHGRWYLLCWSRTRDARRVLRVDRVASVEALVATFEPPADLDPVDAVATQLGEGWRHQVVVEVDAPPEQVEQWVQRHVGRCEPLPGGRTRVVGSTNELPWYAEQLALVDAPFRVLEPPGLRDAVAVLGRRLLQAADGTDEADEVSPAPR
ncbi:WYL domain-containing protein [Angustibacter speluncae]